MKRMLSIGLMVALCLSFAACGSIDKDENPYANLLFPEDIAWGMSVEEVRKILDDTSTAKVEVLTYFPGTTYDSHSDGIKEKYSLFKIEYKFRDRERIEFKDNTELTYIVWAIRDLIEYKDRTKDYHGNMDLEYTRIKDYLSSEYGAPFKEEASAGSFVWLNRCHWEADNNTGVTLTLESVTTTTEQGIISLTYTDIAAVKSPWYE